MRLSLTHRAILLLCLAVFGLGPTFCMPRAVRCTGPTGASRIEFACVKSEDGCCTTSAADAGHDDEHGPCHDEPAGTLIPTARIGHAAPSLDGALAPALEVTPPTAAEAPASAPDLPSATRLEAERPPDRLTGLRTVRLIV